MQNHIPNHNSLGGNLTSHWVLQRTVVCAIRAGRTGLENFSNRYFGGVSRGATEAGLRDCLLRGRNTPCKLKLPWNAVERWSLRPRYSGWGKFRILDQLISDSGCCKAAKAEGWAVARRCSLILSRREWRGGCQIVQIFYEGAESRPGAKDVLHRANRNG